MNTPSASFRLRLSSFAIKPPRLVCKCLFISSLVLGAVQTANAATETLAWSQPFLNNSGAAITLSSLGWSVNVNPTGTLTSTASKWVSNGDGDPSGGVSPGLVFLSLSPGIHGASITPTLVSTTTIASAGININDASRFSFSSRNAVTSPIWQLAVKVDSSWFVSVPIYASASTTTWTTHSIALADTQWNPLSFTENSSLVVNTSIASSLPSSGTITGIGLFTSVGTDQTLRFDTIQVFTAIPEPSTAAFGLGAVALASVALRRRSQRSEP